MYAQKYFLSLFNLQVYHLILKNFHYQRTTKTFFQIMLVQLQANQVIINDYKNFHFPRCYFCYKSYRWIVRGGLRSHKTYVQSCHVFGGAGFSCHVEDQWWPSTVFCSLFRLLSLWHISYFLSYFYRKIKALINLQQCSGM